MMPSLLRMQWKFHCRTSPRLSEIEIHPHKTWWTSRFLCELVKRYLSWCRDRTTSSTFDLKPTTTDDGDARLDIKANELWESRLSKAYFDVKFFNLLAKFALKAVAKPTSTMNLLKTNIYEQRIIVVEKATFCPLFCAFTGGAGPPASKALKQLAWKLSELRWHHTISKDKNQLCSPKEFHRLEALGHLGGAIVHASLGAVVEEGRLLVYGSMRAVAEEGWLLAHLLSPLVFCFLMLSVFCFTLFLSKYLYILSFLW